ncbi:MAG: hypothetical protein JJU34_06465 [Lunatimonas sp.]|uniref:hypothetical protein n=1 Tax=Lunatimonas sp. TaxID=2060141 RepID=UPI00263BABC9|nr:hypothetical protein [Lunatimonas sp.]MCC5936905.1 hypothetical protein [Lunatimonas sp.]
MEIGFMIVVGVTLGLLVIYRSFVHAADDPETFDVLAMKEKFKKPEGWKVGKLPDDLKKPTGSPKKKQTSLSF